jgi:MFS-type transporter involved in bile tolerance (Atg22 family)
MKKLKERWGITSNFQLIIIFIVFAINGSLSAKISAFVLEEFGMTKENTNILLYYILLLILVLPLYPFMLLFFGWLFGQSKFFTPFGKKMIRSMRMEFLLPKEKS